MNIGIVLALVLLLGATQAGGGGGSPPGTPGCVGCCPGTSTYEGMLRARAGLQIRFGSWQNTPWWAQLAHSLGYSQCPGYNEY